MLEKAYPGLPNVRWIAMRLLDGDYRVRQALEKGELQRMQSGLIEDVSEQDAAQESISS